MQHYNLAAVLKKAVPVHTSRRAIAECSINGAREVKSVATKTMRDVKTRPLKIKLTNDTEARLQTGRHRSCWS